MDFVRSFLRTALNTLRSIPSHRLVCGWLMLSVGMLFGAPGDNVKDPIAGKIRITAGASSWDHVDDDTDSVPIELYDVVDNDYVGGATVDGYDSANWTATKGVCVPTTAAVSIVWKATGGVGGTGTATITASLYDKVDNAEADDAANLTLTVTCTGWELTAISPTTIDVLYKGQGKKQTFTATTTPASPPADVAAKISWTANGGTVNPTTGLTSEWTQDASYVSAAVDDVMIACAVGSGPKKEAKTTVVTLDKLQYRKPGTTTWNDVSGTIYVFNGKSVEFKAIKRPAAATWPTNKPVWGGTAGATGNGETKTVAFSTLSTNNTDYKTVTAECGDTKTANNIVFDFEGTFTPDDNCQETATKKRSTTQYGIGEGVELGFKSNPTGISAAQMGGLTWTKTGGLGSLTATANAGTGRFEAGDKPTTTNLHLTIQSGMWQGEKHSYEKMVIKPSGLRYVLVAGSVYAHPPHPVHEAGFEAHVYLDPKDVSFKNVEFLEAAATATLTGWFSAKFPTGHSVPEESRGGCTGGDVNDGTRVSSAILVRQTSGTLPAFAPGTMSVNRDQIARAGTTGEKHTISAVSFTAEVTAAGVKTVTKGSIGPH